jgi:hypothetical protein
MTLSDAFVASMKNYCELSPEELEKVLSESGPIPLHDSREITDEEFQTMSKMKPSEVLAGYLDGLLGLTAPAEKE